VNNRDARAKAGQIVDDFWTAFDDALGAGQCDKQTYLEQLEELAGDVEMRIASVNDEIAAEMSSSDERVEEES